MRSYPVGHLSTMYWLGLGSGDRPFNISSPGWAKHAWSCFFAPWNAGACTVFVYVRAPRIQRQGDAQRCIARHGVTTLLRPSHGLAPASSRRISARVRSEMPELRRAPANRSIPRSSRPSVPPGISRSATAKLRPDGDHRPDRQSAGPDRCKPGVRWDVRCPAIAWRFLDADGQETAEGEVARRISARRHWGSCWRATAGEPSVRFAAVLGGGYYRTWRCRGTATRRAISPGTSAAADDVFKSPPTTASAPSSSKALLIEHEAVAEAAVVPSPDAIRPLQPKAVCGARARGWEPSAETARDRSISISARRHMSAIQAGAAPGVRRSCRRPSRQDPPRRAARGARASAMAPAPRRPRPGQPMNIGRRISRPGQPDSRGAAEALRILGERHGQSRYRQHRIHDPVQQPGDADDARAGLSSMAGWSAARTCSPS